MDTVAVQMTGRGVGAIAVVLVAGRGAEAIVAGMSRSQRARNLAIGETAHTVLHHPESRQQLDDVVVVRLSEDEFEIHLHGGIAVVSAVLNALEAAGATVLTPEESLQRGVLGEGICAEVLVALAGAHTMSAARLLAAQSHEGLAGFINKWLAWLPGKSANDLWRLHSAMQWLLARSAALDNLIHPARIAIVGPPNAGKSTLANALLGRPISITSDIAGTTRDWVDAEAIFTTLSGEVAAPVLLVDTAGIRDTSDVLEQESIARSHEQAALADVVLLVFDGTVAMSGADCELLAAYKNQPLVVVNNKSDAPHCGATDIRQRAAQAIEISALKRTGIDQLMQRVLELLDLHELDSTEPYAFTPRQRGLVEEIAISTEPRRISELMEGILRNPMKLPSGQAGRAAR